MPPTLGVAPFVPAEPPSVDGTWTTDGYGFFIEIRGDEFARYQVTRRSCTPDLKAKRIAASTPDEVRFAGGEVNSDTGAKDEFALRAGPTPDSVVMHVEGAISGIDLRRVSARPATFGKTPANTPQETFEVFWTTFDEHYPFFKLHNCDRAAVGRANRAKVTADTKPDELFALLEGMIAPFGNAHTFIETETLMKESSTAISSPETRSRAMTQGSSL